MKKIIFASTLFLILALQGAEVVSKNGIYILNNSCMTVEIAPANGGKVVRLYDKKHKREIAKLYSPLDAPSGSGLFAERIWSQKGKQYRHYESSSWKVITSKADKNSAEVKLFCASQPLDIEKTYVLNENEPVLRVRYALTNPTDTPFTGRFWSNSVIALQGEKWKITLPRGPYSANLQKGAVKAPVITHDLKSPAPGNHWIVSPQQDYGAVEDSFSGTAITAPWEFLELFYCHIPSGGGANLPTLEWMTSFLHIKPLAVGKADAVNHPELEDPLQDYIVRFETTLTLYSQKDARKLRPLPTGRKNTRFQPILSAATAHLEFPTLPAIGFFAKQKENPRILMFAGHQLAAEAFDFLRRFKSDAEVIEGWRITGGGASPYVGYNIPSPFAMTEKFLKGKVDAIFIPGFTNRTMPKNLSRQLIEKVKKGSVAIYISDRNRFTDLFPAKGGKEIPAKLFRGIPFKVKVLEYKVGKGKIFFVPFRLHLNNRLWSQNSLLLPAPAPDNPSHEYIYALYCRILRYALNHTSPAEIRNVTVTPGKAELEIYSTLAAPASVNGRKYDLKKGLNRIVYPFVPETLNGKHDCVLLLEVNGKSSDFFIARYEVRNAPILRSFNTAKYAHESREPICGSLELEGKGDIILSLLDAEKRIIGTFSKKNVSGKTNFSITPLMFGVNSFCRLEAEVSHNGKVVEKRSLTLSRRTPDDSKIKFVLWHNSRATHTGMIRHKGAREMGFTHLLSSQGHAMAQLDSRLGAEAILQTGSRYMVNTLYRFFQNNIHKEKKFRDPCLRDPEGLKIVKEKTALRAKRHVSHFPVLYYSSDENSLGWHDTAHDYCRTPHCLAAFRKAMQNRYGTLAKLNQVWKSSYKKWEQVTPPTLAEARKSANYAPWLAHRIFMLGALDEGARALLGALRQVDPRAKLAHSGQGLTRLNDCWDWRKMPNHYELSNLYATMGGLPDFLRTLRPGYAAGNWNGYGAPLPQIRFTAWNDIADGMFAPAYWYDCYFFRRGDNELNTAGLHMKKVITEIKSSGADPLMTTGKRVYSPFTLVYSPESLAAAAVTGDFSSINDGTYNGNLAGWVRLIRSAGFPAPQIIGDNKLKDITPSNTPVLVLPLLQLMSDRQIEYVKKYLLSGGILVIDAQAGIFDGFYSLRKNNPLQQLARVKIPLAKGISGGTIQFGNTPVRLIPAGTQAESAGAAVLGAITVNAPGTQFHSIEIGEVKRNLAGAFFKADAGKGKVIYINGLFHGVTSILNDPAPAMPLIKVFRELFAGVGITSVHTGGLDVNAAEYQHGRYRVLLATRRNGSGTAKFTYPLNGKWNCYDSLAHTYTGKTEKVDFSLNAWGVKMFILTRAPLAVPRLKGSVKGGTLVITSLSDSGVWFARLFRNGEELKSLSKTVILDKNDKTEFNFGISPKGECEVLLLNVMNGKKFNYKVNF